MADKELAMALKQAQKATDPKKGYYFVFVPKGSASILIVSKTKIPPADVAEAKKLGAPFVGRCFGAADGSMVFKIRGKLPADAAGNVMKDVAKKAGTPIRPVFQGFTPADLAAEEEEASGAAAPGAAAPAAEAPSAEPAAAESAAAEPAAAAPAAAAPAAPPAAPAQGNVTGIQKALQKLGFDPGKIDGLLGPKTQAAIKQFQQANSLPADGIAGPKTQAALAKALQGGAAAAGGAPTAAAASGAPAAPAATGAPAAAAASGAPAAPAATGAPDLAPWQTARQNAINDLKALASKVVSTKHGSAAGVVKEIQSIITRLPANPAPNDLDKLEDFVRNDETITAAEEVPSHFHELDIREPLLKALGTLKK
jgi:hypothetical protein